MLLNGRSAKTAPALGEDDPLPPEDRVMGDAACDVEQIYREHRPRLLRFFARAASADLAQELCQQLFTRLSGRSRQAAIGDPVAYLHRSARNLIVDSHEREKREPQQVELASATDVLTAPDQLAALEARDMLRRLEASLARLPPRTREIFLAHRLDGYTYREIADRTGLGVKAIEKHMSRAIAHLDRLAPHL